MTADVELLPLPEPNGSCTNPYDGVDLENYARANVEHAVAPLQAEIEALRALAGYAYQMAGFHNAPVVWLDRLSQAAKGEKLPDPDTLADELLPYQPDASSEIEAMWAEVEALRGGAGQNPQK